MLRGLRGGRRPCGQLCAIVCSRQVNRIQGMPDGATAIEKRALLARLTPRSAGYP